MHRSNTMELESYIRRLEKFAADCGAPVVRNALVAGVLGQAEERRIVLRTGMSLDQQLLTLAHELTHLLVHCIAYPRINRTVCEYEAEAVERWVGAVLKVGASSRENIDIDSMTEDLLACSVLRVRRAAQLILAVARDDAFTLASWSLQPQSAVDIDAPPGEEVVLNDELHGMRDFVRLTQAL
jgi:IrrE N-terminal-like domain